MSWVSLDTHPVRFDVDCLRVSCLQVLLPVARLPVHFVLRATLQLFRRLSLVLEHSLLLVIRRLWREAELVVKLLSQHFELREPLAKVVVFKMAACVRILEFPIRIFVKVNSLKIIEI